MAAPDGRRRSLPLLIGVAALVFVADQLTKAWAVDRLSRGDIEVIFDWRLHLVRNSAAAFSVGSGLGPLIGVLALGVVGALLVMSRDYRGRWPTVFVGMIVGGALGNIADRAFRSTDGFLGGEVIDFIDVRFWPVFNVADSAVVLGVIGLAVYTTFVEPRRRPHDDGDSTARDGPDEPAQSPAGSDGAEAAPADLEPADDIDS